MLASADEIIPTVNERLEESFDNEVILSHKEPWIARQHLLESFLQRRTLDDD